MTPPCRHGTSVREEERAAGSRGSGGQRKREKVRDAGKQRAKNAF